MTEEVAPPARKLHTTLERDAEGNITIREVSLCRVDCPDWAWRKEGDIETARMSGELVPPTGTDRVGIGHAVP